MVLFYYQIVHPVSSGLIRHFHSLTLYHAKAVKHGPVTLTLYHAKVGEVARAGQPALQGNLGEGRQKKLPCPIWQRSRSLPREQWVI